MATRKKKIFNLEISLGHVLTICTMALGGAGVWFTTLNDISNLKTKRLEDLALFTEYKAQEKEYKAEQKAANKEMQLTMQKVVIQLEKMYAGQEIMRSKFDARFEARELREGRGRGRGQ